MLGRGEHDVQVLAQRDKGLLGAQVQHAALDRLLHLAHLLLHAVGGQLHQHVFEDPAVHGSHGLQAHAALFKLLDFDVHAVQHDQHFGAVLAAQTTQFKQLLGQLASTVDQPPADLRLDLQRRAQDQLFENLPAMRQKLCTQRLFERWQAAIAKPLSVAADARRQRQTRRQWKYPRRRKVEQA